MSSNAEHSGVILELRGLRSRIETQRGPVYPVNDVSLECHRGRTLAVVGESGSGKSMTFLSTLGLLPAGGVIESGEILFDGQSIDVTDKDSRRALRGKSIGMIFQDALAGLNPAFTIGQQIGDVIRHHDKVSRKVARAQAIETLGLVGIPNPEQRVDAYPHQLSGGMRQRVMIAMGIALRPQVLVADEPTTALDVTVQAQIMELLDSLRTQLGMSLVIITHDLGVVARYAEEVAVMYGGRIVERGTVHQVLESSVHPYTQALRNSTPRPDSDAAGLAAIPGQPPSIADVPAGCSFHPRCQVTAGRDDCRQVIPVLRRLTPDGQLTACHHAEEMSLSATRQEMSA
ncbi:ABC transporter ATP-binding protein [Nocardioides marmoriginsengisoli]|uniref:ABC transporter ATP-binding protein n=1 Tax=Nocardioides marmoriginsengisoli TaxID=661483 RepID=A0A3N0CBH7_9ACTN|nr:ABC transporter ATP-binding protein [Nocardioides marmoriginsengisoli]RNL60805.1 ABC transporter ATP-binding protein [Nocardioides marmoriginsengisoli]